MLPLLLACAASTPPAPATPPPRNALVVVIDTLRADVVAEAHTPVMDALAAQGASASRAWSAATWTAPSVISFMTGLPVRQHGWDLPTGRIGKYPRFPEVDTLASVLHDAGFATAGLYANPYLAEEIGFDRGFDTWHRSVDRVIPRQFRSLVEREWGDPGRHFAYVHFIGPHSPLKPSAAARARWQLDDAWFDEKQGLNIGAAKRNKPIDARATYARAYRAVVEDCDERLGELLEGLGEHRADTLVVVTADHGELLGEHDVFGHGVWVWDILSHVPLIVDDPGLAPSDEVLADPVSLVSLPAIVTTRLGVPHDWPVPAEGRRPLVVQREGRIALSMDGHTRAVWQSPVGRPIPQDAQVFDLESDPSETEPRPDDGSLTRARKDWEASVPQGVPAEFDVQLPDQTTQALQELGYLQPETP